LYTSSVGEVKGIAFYGRGGTAEQRAGQCSRKYLQHRRVEVFVTKDGNNPEQIDYIADFSEWWWKTKTDDQQNCVDQQIAWKTSWAHNFKKFKDMNEKVKKMCGQGSKSLETDEGEILNAQMCWLQEKDVNHEDEIPIYELLRIPDILPEIIRYMGTEECFSSDFFIQTTNKNDETPMHILMQNKSLTEAHIEAIKELLYKNALPGIFDKKDKNGKTPLLVFMESAWNRRFVWHEVPSEAKKLSEAIVGLTEYLGTPSYDIKCDDGTEYLGTRIRCDDGEYCRNVDGIFGMDGEYVQKDSNKTFKESKFIYWNVDGFKESEFIIGLGKSYLLSDLNNMPPDTRINVRQDNPYSKLSDYWSTKALRYEAYKGSSTIAQFYQRSNGWGDFSNDFSNGYVDILDTFRWASGFRKGRHVQVIRCADQEGQKDDDCGVIICVNLDDRDERIDLLSLPAGLIKINAKKVACSNFTLGMSSRSFDDKDVARAAELVPQSGSFPATRLMQSFATRPSKPYVNNLLIRDKSDKETIQNAVEAASRKDQLYVEAWFEVNLWRFLMVDEDVGGGCGRLSCETFYMVLQAIEDMIVSEEARIKKPMIKESTVFKALKRVCYRVGSGAHGAPEKNAGFYNSNDFVVLGSTIVATEIVHGHEIGETTWFRDPLNSEGWLPTCNPDNSEVKWFEEMDEENTEDEGRTDDKKNTVLEAMAAVVYRLAQKRSYILELIQLSGLPSEDVGKIASSGVFRALLQLIDGDTSYFVYRVDVVLYLTLLAFFSKLVFLRAFTEKETEPIWLCAVCFILVTYFALREVVQMIFLRRIEMKQHDRLTGRAKKDADSKKCWFPINTSDCKKPFCKIKFSAEKSLSYLEESLSYLGLTKAWRSDAWNLFDLFFIISVTIVLIMSIRPIENKDAYVNCVTVSLFALYIKLLGYMKSTHCKSSAFVVMFFAMFKAVAVFLVVMGILLIMFGHIFYFRNFGKNSGEDFGLDDDDADPYHGYGSMAKATFMLAFMGEFEMAYYDADYVTLSFFFLFIVIIVVIMMNVLIAIVSEAYEECMATSYEIYWFIFCEQVTEITMVFPPLMDGLKKFPKYGTFKVKEMLKKEMKIGDGAD